jgi:hypothetical protein
MALRSGHRNGAGSPRVEVLPVDELPAGLPAPTRPEAVRDDAVRFVPGAGTSELARKSAKAAHESRELAAVLGLWDVPEDHPYAPYARLGREWRDSHMAQLGATVGGGEVGPGPASVVSSAALQLAASRCLSDKGGRRSGSSRPESVSCSSTRRSPSRSTSTAGAGRGQLDSRCRSRCGSPDHDRPARP